MAKFFQSTVLNGTQGHYSSTGLQRGSAHQFITAGHNILTYYLMVAVLDRLKSDTGKTAVPQILSKKKKRHKITFSALILLKIV